MKFALNVFEELKDSVDYTIRSWLNTEVSSLCHDNLINIIGATAFNFDNLFAKQNAGNDISKIVYENSFDYKRDELSNAATTLRFKMNNKVFDQGESEFKNYFIWISNQEEVLKFAYKDSAGQLILASIDMIVSSIVADKKETIPAMRIAELVFLNLVNTFNLLYKEFFKDRYKQLECYLFLNEIEVASEQIRAQISD